MHPVRSRLEHAGEHRFPSLDLRLLRLVRGPLQLAQLVRRERRSQRLQRALVGLRSRGRRRLLLELLTPALGVGLFLRELGAQLGHRIVRRRHRRLLRRRHLFGQLA